MDRFTRLALLTAVLSLAARWSGAEDLGSRYRYPISIGGQYQTLSPVSDYRTDFDVYDISAVLRAPLPGIASVQPFLQGGVIQFSPRLNDKAWEHGDAYALLGMAWSSRFSQTFEVGADLAFGGSFSMYPNLFPETGTVGNYNLMAQAGGRLGLIPSFNFAIEFSPSLKYLQSLGVVSDFNGFALGLGLSAHIRLGEDPDSAKAALRSIRFGEVGPSSVFPAMQSWYTKNPFATIRISNTESFPLRDVDVSFFQKGYMDSPTLCARIPELGIGESRDIGIIASFNAEVFQNEGATPLSGEIVVTYSGRGRAGEQRASVSYDLHDKSAIIWDDDRKAAAFVTPADSALRNYVSYVRQINKETLQPGYSETVQLACQLFYALGEIGILYQVDPTLPFASAKGTRATLDSVSLPRQTLKRITGDCDDLSVLYAGLLESAGIETALITIPGHIFVAFGTKAAGNAFGDINPDRGMTVTVNDQLWIPIEVTMIGTSTFLDAWRKGIEEWRSGEADPASRGFYPVRQAHEIYRPVGLKETDLGLQYGRQEPVVANSLRDIGRLVDSILDAPSKAASEKEGLNRLGVKLARFGRYDKAAAAFKKAALMDPAYANARMNLGNVYMLTKKYDQALVEYEALEKSLPADHTGSVRVNLQLNISKCFNAMGEYEKAAGSLAKASSIDPSIGEKYAFLARSADGAPSGRASEAASVNADLRFEE
jgi:tetratricopeptide (TPR) repeat protein